MPESRTVGFLCGMTAAIAWAASPFTRASEVTAPGAPIAESASAERIRLTFDWGPSWRARVTRDVTRSRTEQATQASSLVMTHEMLAERQSSGQFVLTSDHETFRQVGGVRIVGPATLGALGSGLVDPPYAVSGEGAYLGLHQPDQVRVVFDERIRTLAAAHRTEQERETIRASLAKLLTLEILDAQVREPWDAFVGGWAGRDFAVGESRETTGEERPALLGRLPVKTVARWTLAGRVPCRAGSVHGKPPRGPADCVRLERRLAYEPESVKQVLATLHARLAPNGAALPEGVIRTLQVETITYVVSEPATLKPHYGELRKVTTATAIKAGVEQTLVQDDATRYTWMAPR